ncbi:hypothetical protein ScPMuIL_014432 [Solemya velum]
MAAELRRMSVMMAPPVIQEPVEESSLVKSMTPHVPGLVTFADHNQLLPWTTTYDAVVMFADISGFTALCEKYSMMENAGIDQLTRTLNEYLGALCDGILGSDGDILKFAGDAILAVWRVNYKRELSATVNKVLGCCLDIQNKCGEWNTDIGIKLTVKMGVSAGTMSVIFLGNNEYRHYIELGPAVRDVNAAEHFCLSGYVVLSPDAWALAKQETYIHEVLEDQKHVRMLYIRLRTFYLHNLKLFLQYISDLKVSTSQTFTDYLEGRCSAHAPVNASTGAGSGVQQTPVPTLKPPQPKHRSIFKLKKLVKTVTGMRLDEVLRLYILQPVLKKIDDNQPLHYLSEMRQVTILFMNLVLAEESDISDLLQKIFIAVYSKTKPMNGCLNKVFLFDKGCTFLVIFGLPGYKHEKDCAHALLCSDEINRVLHKIEGVEMVSIGVTTGVTFCGVVGHMKRHEYSVIGRKVNMAARLMMHYPEKVTCDDITFQLCRLPATNFDVLVTKRMKGLRNVGIIREFCVHEVTDGSAVLDSIPHFKYPILGREMEMDAFLMALSICQREEDHRSNHLLFVGSAGIGKTRFIDALLVETTARDVCVISCALTISELSKPFALARYVFRMLLTNGGFSHQVGREPQLVDGLMTNGLVLYRYLLNEILGTSVTKKIINIYCLILLQCLDKIDNVVVVAIDDAHNMDTESWTFMYGLSKLSHILLVMTLRPFAVETPSCVAASDFMDCSSVSINDLSFLDLKYISALACQLLEVVCIPKELDRLLRDRSYGIPAWCEQLLTDMVENKELMVFIDDGFSNLRLSTITPNINYIKPRELTSVGETQEKEVHKNHLCIPAVTVHQCAHFDEVLTDLGYMNKKKGAKTAKEPVGDRVAKFNPSVKPQDIMIPESMKELVITRLDSLRASEQLIVKCAAVLGLKFTRSMLEGILPQGKRMNINLALRNLKNIGLFECGNIPVTKHGQMYGQDDCGNRDHCYCPENRDKVHYTCKTLSFRNPLLQQTSYDSLMEVQKKELHRKAANYLERMADDQRANIPIHVLEIFPQSGLTEVSSNQSELADGEIKRNHIRKPKKKTDFFHLREIIPVSDMLEHTIIPPESVKESLDALLSMCEDICHHWTAAREQQVVLGTLLEAVTVAIAVGNNISACEKLIKVEKLIGLLDKDHFFLPDMATIIHAKILRLKVKTLIHSSKYADAQKHLTKAGKMLGHTVKEGKFNQKLDLVCLLYRFSQRDSLESKTKRPCTTQSFEKCLHLEVLFSLQQVCEQHSAMLLTALQMYFFVTSMTSAIHQVVVAYVCLIKCCQDRNWKKWNKELENELFVHCALNSQELASDDWILLARVSANRLQSFLNKGDFKNMSCSGVPATSIASRINDTLTGTEMAHHLAQICLMKLELADCMEYVFQLRKYSIEDDNKIAQVWFYNMCLELLLIGAYPIESIQNCVAFATEHLKTCDATTKEMLPRYNLAMSLAVWYARRGEWARAQVWFDYWDMYEEEPTSHLAALCRAKKVECMLLSFHTAKYANKKNMCKRLKRQIKEELELLQKVKKTIESLKSRYHHLKAYFQLLLGRRLRARASWKKGHSEAQRASNKLEERWMSQNSKVWFDTSWHKIQDKEWENYTSKHILEMRLSAFSKGRDSVMFSLPLCTKPICADVEVISKSETEISNIVDFTEILSDTTLI